MAPSTFQRRFARISRRACVSVAAASAILSSSPTAWAFRTIEDHPDVPDGARVHWPHGVFEYRVHDDPEDSIDADSLADASRQALEAWSSVECGPLLPVFLGTTAEPGASGDGKNTIEFVEADWDALGYPSEAAGAADVLFEEREDGTWVIVEADVYINAEHHRFTTSDSPEDDERSLLGVLTHEIGHALGLLHPCDPDGADGAPLCDQEDLPNALMSPFYEADQVFPEGDDFDGLCYLYPACSTDEDCNEDHVCWSGECVPVDDGGTECEPGAGGQGGEECTPKRPIGAECSESNECEGDQCVAGVESFPVCTRLCGEGQPGCPDTWKCATVEDRRVCIPPDRDAGCECVLDRSAPSRSTMPTLTLTHLAGLGLFLLLHLRKARRRRSKLDDSLVEDQA